MNLTVDLINCFGIGKLSTDINFKDKNAVVIYSKNGTMKTSLAKTFKFIQNDKANEIGDIIFNEKGSANIKLRGSKPIGKDQIFVIDSFDESYQSANLANLLVPDEIKELTEKLLSKKQLLLSNLSAEAGIPLNLTENKILSVFNIDNIIKDIKNIQLTNGIKLDVKYNDILSDSLEKKILEPSFQNNIKDYIEATKKIYDDFTFLEEGSFDLLKFKDFAKTAKGAKYFTPSNNLNLKKMKGRVISTEQDLDELNSEIDEYLKGVSSYDKIEKTLKMKMSRALLNLVRSRPEIIESLKKSNLPSFKKQIWKSYLNQHSSLIEEINNLHTEIINKLKSLGDQKSDWELVKEKFHSRFDVPFEMEITNAKDAIIGENILRVMFKFKKGEKTKHRDPIQTKETLSQGEKRALYLLNILFDIEYIKKTRSEKQTFLIIDDIADSFDYRNKYAIIEYLKELSENNRFKLIILSHNFDFYRLVANRLRLGNRNTLQSHISKGEVSLITDTPSNPLNEWIKNPDTYPKIFSLIPFVRNMSEYLKADGSGGSIEKTYEQSIQMLHMKPSTINMTAASMIDILSKIYPNIKTKIDESKTPLEGNYLELLFNSADLIANSTQNLELEDKITLSIAIRLKAELFIIKNLNIGENELEKIKHNQMNVLLERFNKSKKDSYESLLLSRINIITPEHIHINSFMYEPLIDTSATKLKCLYSEISNLR